MEFKVGDDVVHPSHGVGRIVGLEERELGTSGLRWYYVLVVGTSTIWLPVQANGATVLRAVTRPQDLDQYRTTLSGQPARLNPDRKQRHLDLSERLTQCSFQVICEVVRDLSALGWSRPMGDSDATMLKRVHQNLWREWAAAPGQSEQDAIREIESLLLAGRLAYQASQPPRQ